MHACIVSPVSRWFANRFAEISEFLPPYIYWFPGRKFANTPLIKCTVAVILPALFPRGCTYMKVFHGRTESSAQYFSLYCATLHAPEVPIRGLDGNRRVNSPSELTEWTHRGSGSACSLHERNYARFVCFATYSSLDFSTAYWTKFLRKKRLDGSTLIMKRNKLRMEVEECRYVVV